MDGAGHNILARYMMIGMKRSRLGHWRVQTESKYTEPLLCSLLGADWCGQLPGGITVVPLWRVLMGEVYNVLVWASPWLRLLVSPYIFV